MKQEIITTKAPAAAYAYSQAIKKGNRIYVAGTGPVNVETREIGETIEEQTKQVLKNIQVTLEEAGATMDDVVKVTVHLQNLKRDFIGFDTAYKECFNKPYPVRTTVGSELAGILVEIDVIAEI